MWRDDDAKVSLLTQQEWEQIISDLPSPGSSKGTNTDVRGAALFLSLLMKAKSSTVTSTRASRNKNVDDDDREQR